MHIEPKSLILLTKLNRPMKAFFWDLDQAMIAVAFIGMGIITRLMAPFFALGIFLAHRWQKLKGGRSHYFLIHAAFWFLPVSNRSKRVGFSSKREYLR